MPRTCINTHTSYWTRSVCTCLLARIHTHHTGLGGYTHARMQAYTHIILDEVSTHARIHTHACTHTHIILYEVSMHIHACTHAYTCMHAHTCTHTHTCMLAHTHIILYEVSTHACPDTHACMHTHHTGRGQYIHAHTPCWKKLWARLQSTVEHVLWSCHSFYHCFKSGCRISSPLTRIEIVLSISKLLWNCITSFIKLVSWLPCLYCCLSVVCHFMHLHCCVSIVAFQFLSFSLCISYCLSGLLSQSLRLYHCIYCCVTVVRSTREIRIQTSVCSLLGNY